MKLIGTITSNVPQVWWARILELGKALGFTACCLASSGVAVEVDTIEGDPQHVRLAQANVKAAGLADRIAVHQGRF